MTERPSGKAIELAKKIHSECLGVRSGHPCDYFDIPRCATILEDELALLVVPPARAASAEPDQKMMSELRTHLEKLARDRHQRMSQSKVPCNPCHGHVWSLCPDELCARSRELLK